MDEPRSDANSGAGNRVRGFNQDVGAGLFLIGIAAIGALAASPLRLTLPSGLGPGMMPMATAAILGAFGLLLVVQGLTNLGERLETWSLRGIIFLFGGVLLFGATVRTLGLVVAGPLAILVSALADRDTRWTEIIPFALILTTFCVVLFKYMLRQPIPLAPFWLGY